jgi:hypothetical protein
MGGCDVPKYVHVVGDSECWKEMVGGSSCWLGDV